MTRVLVAAASAVVRAGLESIVRAHESFEVAGAVGSSDLASEIENSQPDVILADLERGRDGVGLDGIGFAGSRDSPGLVLLVDHADAVDVADMLRQGARGVLLRDAAPEEIKAAVEAAAVGLVTLNPDAATSLLGMLPLPSRTVLAGEVETLTPREIEVLGMLAAGEGNKMIARRMGISEHTVKFHVGSILGKLRASSRTEAVTVGVRRGLIMV
ncbi:MAG: LuxR C-terminal-related transcriptional regulator [Chloroflexota bacterium]